MPKPVEALPCGSMSITSVGAPTAAKAVPRLIAVVVLPTPPFWLAITRTRGLVSDGAGPMDEIPDLQNRPQRMRFAGVGPDSHLPELAGIGQLKHHILALEKQAHSVRADEILCIGKKLRQRGAGPRG